ncbi:hypothetical protein AQUCO_01300470v1 [Aquilegia coerulea]|uniref:Uncharacterized protein n=1 Tax=Aquilegia coerulea TaxID=218851 RepID=A0A2G5E1U6_AQUCA|nr:hypothetical protein AQUCO_01300470v1 [Aquilegia coerulea]
MHKNGSTCNEIMRTKVTSQVIFLVIHNYFKNCIPHSAEIVSNVDCETFSNYSLDLSYDALFFLFKLTKFSPLMTPLLLILFLF